MTITTIILDNDDVMSTPIQGVIVRVFTTTGTFTTSGTTDSSGVVVFDLPDADYDLTFFKQAVSPVAGQPQRVTVSSADPDDPPNTFLVKAHVTDMPEAEDPTVCRISGYVRGLNGKPTKELRIAFGMCPDTAVLDGFIIAPQSTLEVHPDEDGYFEFDLLRGMKYTAYFPQLESLFENEPASVLVVVPDLPALLIKDLLFPVPVIVDFTSQTISLTAGAQPADESIGVTITYSDGSINRDGIRPLPPWFTNVSIVNSNPNVASVEFQVDKLVITPLAAGTTTATFTRYISKKYLIYDPAPSFEPDSILVTVT